MRKKVYNFIAGKQIEARFGGNYGKSCNVFLCQKGEGLIQIIKEPILQEISKDLMK